MRADSKGMFWEDTDYKTEKKETLLEEEGWVQSFPGFWAEEWKLETTDDVRTICMSLDSAYALARKNKTGEKCVPPDPVWLAPDYLPGLDEARQFNIPILTDEELIQASLEIYTKGHQHKLVYDIECYGNYFCIGFISVDLGKVTFLELSDEVSLECPKLKWIFENFCTIGFNSKGYDEYIGALAVHGCSTAMMKSATTGIIVQGQRGWELLRHYKVKKLKLNSIDLIEVAPLSASLKIYGGRMHSKLMQDLPFHPDTVLTEPQRAIVRWYCVNDLRVTVDLYKKVIKDIALRIEMGKDYGLDLRSKSDAQIAEAILGQEIGKMNACRPHKPKIEPGTVYYYRVPQFLKFQTPLMNNVLTTVYNSQFIVSEQGSIGLPPELKSLLIKMNQTTYKMGIGGIHSQESRISHYSDPNTILKEVDVTSYYPYIILLLGLYPSHLGPNFLIVFRQLVERRIAAKRSGDKRTADSLKIVINGTFGKLASKYSILYSPDLMSQVTITGQLSLLMLVERLELAGIPVVSANTDGVVIKCPKQQESIMDNIVEGWETDTGFNTEETLYKSLHSRDVNNYIAIKHPDTCKDDAKIDDLVKTKGIFATPGLSKNPQNEICVLAVKEFLIYGKPVQETVLECKDITKFLNVRTVKGGAVKVTETYNNCPKHETKEDLLITHGYHNYSGNTWNNLNQEGIEADTLENVYNHIKQSYTVPTKTNFLGKAIRWYYAKDQTGPIVYAKSGKKVPKSDGAKPLMTLPDLFPRDVNYEWYINEAYKIIKNLGI